jgi:flagellar basal-body rod modification protein FlgD
MTNTISGDETLGGVQDPYSVANRRAATSPNDSAKDAFMKVFLAQMKMQDPMKPFDSSSMLQQLSQLTALSATEELQKTVKNLNQSMSESQVMQATQLIGHKVQIPGDVSPLVDKEGLSGSVLVTQPASAITITIKDSSGNIVKTIEKGPSDKGVLDFDWDGIDNKGNPAKADMYRISASATVDGKQQAMIVSGTFKVNSVALDPKKGVILNVDGWGGVTTDNVLKII